MLAAIAKKALLVELISHAQGKLHTGNAKPASSCAAQPPDGFLSRQL